MRNVGLWALLFAANAMACVGTATVDTGSSEGAIRAGADGGDASDDDHGDASAPDASGDATILGLRCSEHFTGQRLEYALDIKWYPPEPLELDLNDDRVYSVNLDFQQQTVTEDGLSATSTWKDASGKERSAKLEVARKSREGTITFNGKRYAIDCFSVSTSAWESRFGD